MLELEDPRRDRPTWQPWREEEVVDASYPAFACRTYLEQRDVRRFLHRAACAVPVNSAADLGCGFGRMTPVLREVASAVVGFEREPGFVERARSLWPDADFRRVDSLASLPCPDGCFDFVLSFTVLQHVPDADLPAVAEEIKRVLRRPGHLLLCEETDERHVAGDTTGRSIARYEALLEPLRLVEWCARGIEPTYPRADVGTYMLFAG